MKPVHSITPQMQGKDQQNVQPVDPSERDQESFSEMMRQRKREAPDAREEESPWELLQKRNPKKDDPRQSRRDDFDPDYPLDDPTDAQMEMLQKHQKEKHERQLRQRRELLRRNPNQQGQPAPNQDNPQANPFLQGGNPAGGNGNPQPSGGEGTATAQLPAGQQEAAAQTGSQQANLWLSLKAKEQGEGQTPTLGQPIPKNPDLSALGGEATGNLGQLSGKPTGEEMLAGIEQAAGEAGPSEGPAPLGGQPQNAGEAILGILQQSHRGGEAMPVEAAKAAQTISDVADKIVDRILVSDTNLNGKDEVRLMLKNSVLPGTEVRITRHGGQLEIQLVTNNNDAYRLLNERQDGLQSYLNQRLKDSEVNVQLRFNDHGAGGGDNHSGRDSQGRSRQRRSIVEEQENIEES